VSVPTFSVSTLNPGTADADVKDLLAAAQKAHGHSPLSDDAGVDLKGASSRQWRGLAARLDNESGYVGYAHVANLSEGWSVEVVTRPLPSDPELDVGSVLLAAAVLEVERLGGGLVRYWATRAGAASDAIAKDQGFVADRDLLQLRVPLPLSRPPDAPPVALRAFVPGQDETEWLAVNNRAFAGHPEQGHWDPATLKAREGEPWFDPQGFLIAEDQGRIAGSCWTKVHAASDPPLGEIYVISVDPSHQHSGLGRALTVAGLDWLAGQGLRVGMLYVDAANHRAVALYESLGFTLDHIDRAYTATVPPG
jgi:mycothiol synthase